MKKLFCIGLVVTALFSSSIPSFAMARQAVDKPSMTHVKTLEGISEYVLTSNGLRVLLKEDRSSPVVAVLVHYGVGSRDEEEGFSGTAHFLEHMLFKGTTKYQKALGTAIPNLLQGVGALINATTTYDSTRYYEILPSDKLELALDIEASRMHDSLLLEKDFISEKAVIENELERYFDSPEITLSNKVWQTAFTKHPYHRPIIGWRSEIFSLPAEAIRRIYKKFYQPQNATLIVVGDFETDEILKMIIGKFGEIPGGERVETKYPVEPLQEKTRRVDVYREQGNPVLMIAHRMPGALSDDAISLKLLSMVLARGKNSRLYQALLEPGWVSGVTVENAETSMEGLFTTQVTLNDKADHDLIGQKILKVYQQIIDEGVQEEELERVLHSLEIERYFSREGALSVANQISAAVGFGDWTYDVHFIERAKKVTLHDLQKVSAEYLKPEQMIVGRLLKGKDPQPEKAEEFIAELNNAVGEEDASPDVSENVFSEELQRMLKKSARKGHRSFYKENVRVIEKENLTLLFLPTAVDSIVSLTGSFDFAGFSYHQNPFVALLTSKMLSLGTQNKTKLEVASLLEEREASINYGVDDEHLGFNARSLRRDLPLVIELLFEQMQMPLFDEEEFEKLKDNQKVFIRQAMASTTAVGRNRMAQVMFPEGHPRYRYDFSKQLKWLEEVTLDDLKAFHRENYGFQNLILSVVGDFDPQQVEKKVTASFKEGKNKKGRRPDPDFTNDHPPHTRENITLADVVNYDVYFGERVNLKINDPDYVPFLIANHIIGGDFHARLSSVLRDDLGYTYGIQSGYVDASESLTGMWLVRLIVNPEFLERAISETENQIVKFVNEGVAEHELERAKQALVGQFKIGLATVSELSNQLLAVKQNQRDISYLDDYPEQILSVTREDLNRVIRESIDPQKIHIVSVGKKTEGPVVHRKHLSNTLM